MLLTSLPCCHSRDSNTTRKHDRTGTVLPARLGLPGQQHPARACSSTAASRPKPPRFNRARPARVHRTRTIPVCSPPVSARTSSSAAPLGHTSGARCDPRGKGVAEPPPVTRTTRFVPLGRSGLPSPQGGAGAWDAPSWQRDPRPGQSRRPQPR